MIEKQKADEKTKTALKQEIHDDINNLRSEFKRVYDEEMKQNPRNFEFTFEQFWADEFKLKKDWN